MFFKIIRFIVIAGVSFTCTLNGGTCTLNAEGPSTEPHIGARDTELSTATAPGKSDFDQFLDALDFGDYKDSTPHNALLNPLFITGALKGSITAEWCIKNVACGSPLVIQKFMELNTGLDAEQEKLLTFLSYVSENGKPKHTTEDKLFGRPPAPFSGDFTFSSFLKDPFSFYQPSLTHDMIYKLLFYTGHIIEAYEYITYTRKLNVAHTLEKQGSLLRLINTPEARHSYALMLKNKQISLSYDGKRTYATDQERYDEAARLYREANIPEAKISYALMLDNNKIRLSYDGKRTYTTDQECYQEAARLYREANTPNAKNNYALMLGKNKIRVSYDGKKTCTTDQERYQEAARLYREANIPDAKHNYAIMLQDNKICLSYDGKNTYTTDKERYDEAARLYREANIPEARHNYALMLGNNKIRLSYDGKRTYTTDQERYQEAARLYREANIPETKNSYALMLDNNNIRLSYDGKNTYATDQECYQEAARLYREANIPNAQFNYAIMLRENKISLSYDGKKTYATDQERYDEAARLYREAGTPEARHHYALMLKNKQISLSYDGKKTYATDQEHYQEAARLHRETNIPETKNSYALMLNNNKIRLSYDGKKTYTTDQKRYQEAARLYREANIPDAKNNYAIILQDNKICLSYDGKNTYTTDKERYDEAARLYREANTPLAKHNLLLMILLHGYRETFSGDSLEGDNNAYQHVIDTLTDPAYKQQERSAQILALAYEKLGKLEEAFQFRTNAEELGAEPIDINDEEDSSSNSDQEEESTEKSETLDAPKQYSPKETRALKQITEQREDKRRKKEKQKASKAAHSAKAVVTFDVSDNAITQAHADALQTWKAKVESETEDNKAKRHAKIQKQLTASSGNIKKQDFSDYEQVFENGASITHVPDNFKQKFTDLIQGIKEKNGEGTPHMLSGSYNGFKLIARSITKKDRIVYYFDHEQKQIVVVQCKGHYNDT